MSLESSLTVSDVLTEGVSSLSENTNPFLSLSDLFRNLTSSSGPLSSNLTNIFKLYKHFEHTGDINTRVNGKILVLDGKDKCVVTAISMKHND